MFVIAPEHCSILLTQRHRCVDNARMANAKKTVEIRVRGVPLDVWRRSKASAVLRGLTLEQYVIRVLARQGRERNREQPGGTPGQQYTGLAGLKEQISASANRNPLR